MVQLDLFPPPPLDTSADAALAARRPAGLYLGTSSWTFPGWAGLVYRGRPSRDELVEHGLAEYARHPLFNTVGVDRSLYAPVPAEAWRRYAGQLPPRFPCVVKVWNAYTAPLTPDGGPNPSFLDAEGIKRDVLEPLEQAFAGHLGVLLFQLPPASAGAWRSLRPTFLERVDRLFRALPADVPYAVEVRSPELVSASYLALLARHRVAHVLTHWERMPPLAAQLDTPGALTTSHVVCRLLLPQGVGYDEAREAFAPFDRLQAVDEPMRAAVERLFRACQRSGRSLTVLVNNKAEGCSPLTVRALLHRLSST